MTAIGKAFDVNFDVSLQFFTIIATYFTLLLAISFLYEFQYLGLYLYFVEILINSDSFN